MKRLGEFLLPPGWDASLSQGYPSIKFAGTYLYTWVERGAVRVKCLAQEQNTMSPARDPGPLDPETSALTMRPPRLPQLIYTHADFSTSQTQDFYSGSGSISEHLLWIFSFDVLDTSKENVQRRCHRMCQWFPKTFQIFLSAESQDMLCQNYPIASSFPLETGEFEEMYYHLHKLFSFLGFS